MKVRLYSKNIAITKSIDVLITQKLINPVKRLLFELDGKIDVPFDIEIGKSSVKDVTIQWFCEVNISLPGISLPLRVRVSAASFDGAVNGVKDGIEERIKKFKGKKRAQVLRGARRVKNRFRNS